MRPGRHEPTFVAFGLVVFAIALSVSFCDQTPRPEPATPSGADSAAPPSTDPARTEAPGGASPSVVVTPVTSPSVAPSASNGGATAKPTPTAATVPPVVAVKPHRIPVTGTIRGQATTYATGGPGMYAAMPGHRWHHTTWVRVCAGPKGSRLCRTLPVVDFCACGGKHVIDLSAAAWAVLSRGRAPGILEVVVYLLGAKP